MDDTTNKEEIFNLHNCSHIARKYWYLYISAIAFFVLNLKPNISYCIGIIISITVFFFLFPIIVNDMSSIKKNDITTKVLSTLSAISICWSGVEFIIYKFNYFHIYDQLQLIFQNIDAVKMTNFFFIVISALSFPVIYYFLTYFYSKLHNLITTNKLFSDVSNVEIIILLSIFLLTSIGVIYSYSQSYAYYYAYDIIYTSDSGDIFLNNAYLNLTHYQNDLRQPLFSLFSAPFIGCAFFISKLIPQINCLMPILISLIQVGLLIAANYVLSKCLDLSGLYRICFICLCSCTYSYMLSSIMMEQYIFAYFWLILVLYEVTHSNNIEAFHISALGGTLITSLVALPFTSYHNPIKHTKFWFIDMLKKGFVFIATMLLFGRFDIFANSISTIKSLTGYTGKTITIQQKLFQFTNFVQNIFLAPKTIICTNSIGLQSWQLSNINSIQWFGVIMFILAIIGGIITSNKLISKIMLYWIAFSVFMLVILGWGTEENGLVLYTLYFGWAYIGLIYQLIQTTMSKISKKWGILLVSFMYIIFSLLINSIGILELIQFSINYYPT